MILNPELSEGHAFQKWSDDNEIPDSNPSHSFAWKSKGGSALPTKLL